MVVRWSYGVTCVEMRHKTTLPLTLEKLRVGGFNAPTLFLDGSEDILGWRAEFNLPITARSPPVRAYANWLLTLLELFCRSPDATHFAIFQDDITCPLNLRAYLEKTGAELCDQKGYLNLYTFPSNQTLGTVAKPDGGWFKSNQLGRGALGLVFGKQGVIDLLSSRSMVDRIQDANRGHKNIDGAVVTAMTALGYTEWCHSPSLIQHTGQTTSTIGNRVHPLALNYLGDNFDLMTL